MRWPSCFPREIPVLPCIALELRARLPWQVITRLPSVARDPHACLPWRGIYALAFLGEWSCACFPWREIYELAFYGKGAVVTIIVLGHGYVHNTMPDAVLVFRLVELLCLVSLLFKIAYFIATMLKMAIMFLKVSELVSICSALPRYFYKRKSGTYFRFSSPESFLS